jgi:glycosyltransferase involved in cell wall biosynthesis
LKTASIIMPTFNKASRLKSVLESFAFQTSNSFEVIVCNDGSVDETTEVLSQFAETNDCYPLKVIHSSNKGAGAARNKAVGMASGDILIFNDDDMVPAPRFVEAHVKLASSGKVVSRGERWGAPLDQVDSFLQVKASKKQLEWLWSISKLSIGENWAKRALTENPDHQLRWLQSCTSNLAISREGFDKAKGFDEHYGTRWGAEDTDFGFCANREGWVMTWNPHALNCHLEHSVSSRDKFERALPNFTYMKNKYNERATDALYNYILLKVNDSSAHELFNEDDFTEDIPPQIVY